MGDDAPMMAEPYDVGAASRRGHDQAVIRAYEIAQLCVELLHSNLLYGTHSAYM